MRGSPSDYRLTVATLNRLDGDRMAAAAELGLSLCAVRNAIEWAHRHKVKVKPSKVRVEAPGYEPTPEEIAEKTAELKKTWSPYERYRRSGGLDGGSPDNPLETPVIARESVVRPDVAWDRD